MKMKFRTCFLKIASCLVFLTPAQGNDLSLTGCIRGTSCSQCPADRYTTDAKGDMLCCSGCAKALLYHGDNPEKWCVCYVEANGASEVESRTIKFPSSGSSRLPPSVTGSHFGTDVFFGTNTHRSDVASAAAAGGNIKDALHFLSEDKKRGADVSLAVHEALTLMANTIEELNARLTRLEDIIFHAGLGSHEHITDRTGTAASSSGSLPSGGSCPGVNFTWVGGSCYHASVWRDHRAVWEDANKVCEKMGAKLAEPLDSTSFTALTQYLSLAASTTGYSYWIGGLYPGVSWLWTYAGSQVTLNPSYWTGVDAAGNRVSPGDTTPGRCLSFSYLHGASNYFFAADECGYEKYYVCELLDRSLGH